MSDAYVKFNKLVETQGEDTLEDVSLIVLDILQQAADERDKRAAAIANKLKIHGLHPMGGHIYREDVAEAIETQES